MTVNFIMGLPHTSRGYDSIWVIVDPLTKFLHFILARSTLSAKRIAYIYIQEIVWLHEVPISTISDRGSQFTSNF